MSAAPAEATRPSSARVELSSPELTVVAYPAHGFVITVLAPTESGVNLLWERADPPLHDLGSAPPTGPAIREFDESVFAGGWFVMFPLAGIPGVSDDIPMHGEAPRIAWEQIQVSRSSVTCRAVLPGRFDVQRSLRLAGRSLEVTTEVLNLSETEAAVTFGEHPCFSRSVFAGGAVRADVSAASIPPEASDPEATRYTRPQTFPWPRAERRDGPWESVAEIPAVADGRHDHICAALSSAELAVSSPRLSGSLLLHANLAELPHLLLWEHFAPSRTPWSGDVFALELCSAPGRTLDDARAAGELSTIAAGATIRWTVTAEWRPTP